jgi:hypothetical protein
MPKRDLATLFPAGGRVADLLCLVGTSHVRSRADALEQRRQDGTLATNVGKTGLVQVPVFAAGPVSGFQLVLLQLHFRSHSAVPDCAKLAARRMAVLPLPSVVIHPGPGNTGIGTGIHILAHSRIFS